MKQRHRRKSGVIGDDAPSTGSSSSNTPILNTTKNIFDEHRKEYKLPKVEKNPLKRPVESKVFSPAKKKKSPPLISNKLKQFGNAKAWADLVSHLSGEKKHEPVLLYGPVGCGKSLGVQDCLKLCNINCTLLDGSAPESPHELDYWISQVRDNSVLEGDGGVLFIDDIESFTEQCREIILKHVQKTDKTKSPLIISCTNYYAYDLRDFIFKLKKYTNIRLYPPNKDVVFNFLKSKGYSTNIVNSVIPSCKGDLRHSEIIIKMFYQTKFHLGKNGRDNSFSPFLLDRTSNIFELSNSLLTNKDDKWFEIFSANGDTSHVSNIRLLHENLPSLLHETTRINIRDPIESYARIVDSFTNTTWNCLPEIVYSSGLLCRHLLLCKTVTNKWSFPADKSRIVYNTKKECYRFLRDSYINRANIYEKRYSLKKFYESVYDADKVPSTENMTASKLDETFSKINPCRLFSSSINYWDVPKSLGGLKLF